MVRSFWNDESGFLVSAELVLISTILIIGLVVGLIEIEGAILHELNDVGEAIGSLNQSFSFPGTTTTKGTHVITTAGSIFVDTSDTQCCDCNQTATFFCVAPVPHPGGG